jgi:molybdenum cofactor cytidylyltransferase
VKLSSALRVNENKIIAFVGAGGKSTAMFKLAREIAPCLVATTTRLGSTQHELADKHFIVGDNENIFNEIEANSNQGVTLITRKKLKEGKWGGLKENEIAKLKEIAGYHDLPLLIEADGARHMLFKAPAEHEPVIPEFVDAVVVVTSLAVIGKPLTDKFVHRPEVVAEIGKWKVDDVVDASLIEKVLCHPQGGLKNIPSHARRIALLTDADTRELQSIASDLSTHLLSTFHTTLTSVLNHPTSPIFARREKIAGIILAAGESARFGQPKQLLDYHGKPFIRCVAETALLSGLEPVIVVTGAFEELVNEGLGDRGLVKIVESGKWRDGQSESIKVGLNALTPEIGGAIFLLADQPQITPTLIRALIERHAASAAPIIAPLIADRRANPVLFDRNTFNELMKLAGDTGGRALFTKYKLDYVTWHDESMLIDVDTEADYQRLMENEQ